MDELTCAVDEIRETARELLKSKVSAEERKQLADTILQETKYVSDAADTIYAQCEEDYAEGDDLFDREVYAPVVNRLPLAHQVRTDELVGRI